MQPYVFPYIGYYQLIHAADKFVFLDDVSFINKGWINRNNILINGKAHIFTIPLKNASQNRLIKDIDVDDKWRAKFLKTIELAYKKAPHFSGIYSLIGDVMNSGNNISDLAKKSIKLVSGYLNMACEFIDSSAKYANENLKGEDRIIDINKRENGQVYINPQGGRDLYSKEKFSGEGISLQFLIPQSISYEQFQPQFVPWLSIIDVLMFNSKEKTKELMSEYVVE